MEHVLQDNGRGFNLEKAGFQETTKRELGLIMNLPQGCRFRTICNYTQRICESEPELREIALRNYVACHLH